jgi:hypothetical protein
MGSGSRGGGSGVSSGGGSGSGGGGNGGGNINTSDVRTSLQETFRRFPKEYIDGQFGNPLIAAAYDELLSLSRHMASDDPIGSLSKAYDIPADEPGFLHQWVSQIFVRHEAAEPNAKFRETARASVEDFLIDAVKDDIDTYLRGTGSEVAKKIEREKLEPDNSLVALLSVLIWHIIEREYGRQPQEVIDAVKEEATIMATRIADDTKAALKEATINGSRIGEAKKQPPPKYSAGKYPDDAFRLYGKKPLPRKVLRE